MASKLKKKQQHKYRQQSQGDTFPIMNDSRKELLLEIVVNLGRWVTRKKVSDDKETISRMSE